MQYNNTETKIFTDDTLFFAPPKKIPKARKWQEMETLKAQQKLLKELREIDQSFDYSLSELV